MNRMTFLAAGLTLAVSSIAGAETPLSAEFTYQGVLKQGSAPLNGTADLRFALFDAATAGNQIGLTISFDLVTVNNGLITQPLDFGGAAFNGQSRWLEIALRSPAGSGSYTTLTPRQPVRVAPYALRALNASVSGTQPALLSFTNPANTFNGSAISIDQGTLHTQNGRVGIGAPSPAALLHVGAGAGFDPNGGTTLALESNANQYMSMLAPDASESGLLFGRPSATNPTAAGGIIFNNTFTPDGFQFRAGGDNATRMTITGPGNVGIGTATPAAMLHVAGNARVDGAIVLSATARVKSFTSAAFIPYRDLIAHDRGDMALYGTSPGAFCSFVADVQLPDGAVVTSLTGYFEDYTLGADMSLTLYRRQLNSAGFLGATMASVNTSGSSVSVQVVTDSTINQSVIDNSVNGYHLFLDWFTPTPGTDLKFSGAKITYTVTAPLP